MDTELNARGIVIGERYRVAGALRRTGVIEAIDLDAERGAAACRIVGIPGDAAAVDEWEDAWRVAETPAGLPHLLEVVTDQDGAAWAAFAAAEETTSTLPLDARRQAYAIGMALAKAGLDVADLSAAMLVANSHGQLVVDGIPFLGAAGSPRRAAEQLVALLPADQGDRGEADCREPDWLETPTPRVARRRSSTRSRRRLVVPGAIGLVAIAALLALLVPARSAGTPAIGTTIEAPPADVLLGDAAHPVVAVQPEVTVTVTEPAAPASAAQPSATPATVDAVPLSREVDHVVAISPLGDVPTVPLAESAGELVLPVASDDPARPVGN